MNKLKKLELLISEIKTPLVHSVATNMLNSYDLAELKAFTLGACMFWSEDHKTLLAMGKIL